MIRTSAIGRIFAITRRSPTNLCPRIYAASTAASVRNLHSFRKKPVLLLHAQNVGANSFLCRRMSDLPEHLKIKLPALSPTMKEGNIAGWEKNVGDQVSEGDLLCEIETDKTTMGFDSSEEGYIAAIFHGEGAKGIPVGALLCIIVEDEASVAAFKDYKPTEEEMTGGQGSVLPSQPAAQPAAPAAPTPPPAAAPPPVAPITPPPAAVPPPPAAVAPPTPVAAPAQPPAAAPQAPGAVVPATPFAKTLAKERGIDIASVTGSGPDGEVRASDVLSFAPSVSATPQPPVAGAGYVDIPLTNVRQVIAARLLQSKQTVPHYYLTVDVDMQAVVRLRRELNSALQKEGIKLSINDFVTKATALASRKVPEANSSWQDSFIRQYSSVDVSMAVATDNGLITPIIFSADTKGLATINAETQALAKKARENKLLPQEFQGGTITISNLGMFGVDSFSAIINPPQACILAVGATKERLVADGHSSRGYRMSDVMTVTLSCDHRVVDGAVGAQWLAEFRKLLETPTKMLL